MDVLGLLCLMVWAGLITVHGGFWRMRERDDSDAIPPPARWPAVTAVVPARDEADVIERAIGSLLDQDYPGPFRIVLVDDNSSDGTGDLARALAAAKGSDRLQVITGSERAQGWTGKLWAVSQGIAAAGETPDYLLLTDADIAHTADNLRSMVARAEAGKLHLVSLMAKLRCHGWAEQALVPAFIYFFQMLYPFARVNSPRGKGAAAGGCMLVRRETLARAGGIAMVRGALIDDCAVGALIKRRGRIWLGLTERAHSIRPYDDLGSVADMVSRSAYAQLRYSPLLLAGTLVGMSVIFLAPPLLALAAHGPAGWGGAIAWSLMALSFQPVLRFYRQSPLWGLALPVIAAFYSGCTFRSAWQHWQGRGGMWKGRAQAAVTG